MLTLRQDGRWRRRAIEAAALPPGGRVLDLATGTGVFAFDWVDRLGKGLHVAALDLTPAMLVHTKGVRDTRAKGDPVSPLCGRAEALPFPDAAFDAVSIGLALRNFSDLEGAFAEIVRVLRPDGRLVSVDFTRPANPLLRRLYYVYLCRALPAVGRAISHEWDVTFEYLWRTILRFRPVSDVVEAARAAGLVGVHAEPLTGGIATLLVGTRP